MELGIDYLKLSQKLFLKKPNTYLEEILQLKANLKVMLSGRRIFKQLPLTTFTHYFDDKYKGILKGGIYKKPKRRR